MAKGQTPIFMPNDASPKASKLLRAIIDATAAYETNPVDLANAYFSGMCYALSRMPVASERNALLALLIAMAEEAVSANVNVAKNPVGHHRKKR